MEGDKPLKLNNKSKIKKGEYIIPITGVPLIRHYTKIDTNTFGVIANSDNLAVGDVIEIVD